MPDPTWLPPVDRSVPLPPEAHMALAIEIALACARNGGGPFGAVIADPQGRVLELGWNQVVATHDSTAHAEIVAMRRAQARTASHLLPGHTLYTSCAPCIQCYGAIYWSGINSVYASARKEDAEALGFDEGPAMDGLWAQAARARNITLVRDFRRDAAALAPFDAYRLAGGIDYSHR